MSRKHARTILESASGLRRLMRCFSSAAVMDMVPRLSKMLINSPAGEIKF